METLPSPIKTKVCHHCKQILPVTAFNRKQSNRDGLNGICKACKSQYAKEAKNKAKKEVAIAITQAPQNTPVEPIDKSLAPQLPPDPLLFLGKLFDGYTEMLDQIQSLAKKDYRDICHQILWMLHQVLSAKEG